MAKLKLDLRKEFRAAGNRAQDENKSRLLAAQTVNGGAFAPRKRKAAPIKTRKRIRLGDERVNLSDLSGKPGIRTGELLKDADRRGNVKVGRAGVKVIPRAGAKAWVFNQGDEHQAPRPYSGVSDELHQDTADEIARAAREQATAFLQRGRRW